MTTGIEKNQMRVMQDESFIRHVIQKDSEPGGWATAPSTAETVDTGVSCPPRLQSSWEERVVCLCLMKRQWAGKGCLAPGFGGAAPRRTSRGHGASQRLLCRAGLGSKEQAEEQASGCWARGPGHGEFAQAAGRRRRPWGWVGVLRSCSWARMPESGVPREQPIYKREEQGTFTEERRACGHGVVCKQGEGDKWGFGEGKGS